MYQEMRMKLTLFLFSLLFAIGCGGSTKNPDQGEMDSSNGSKASSCDDWELLKVSKPFGYLKRYEVKEEFEQNPDKNRSWEEFNEWIWEDEDTVRTRNYRVVADHPINNEDVYTREEYCKTGRDFAGTIGETEFRYKLVGKTVDIETPAGRFTTIEDEVSSGILVKKTYSASWHERELVVKKVKYLEGYDGVTTKTLIELKRY